MNIGSKNDAAYTITTEALYLLTYSEGVGERLGIVGSNEPSHRPPSAVHISV
jgi:hypothetical protein